MIQIPDPCFKALAPSVHLSLTLSNYFLSLISFRPCLSLMPNHWLSWPRPSVVLCSETDMISCQTLRILSLTCLSFPSITTPLLEDQQKRLPILISSSIVSAKYTGCIVYQSQHTMYKRILLTKTIRLDGGVRNPLYSGSYVEAILCFNIFHLCCSLFQSL